MFLRSPLFWHEFRQVVPLKTGAIFAVLFLLFAGGFFYTANPEASSVNWDTLFTPAAYLGLPVGMGLGVTMVINPRNPAALHRTLPTPFRVLAAARLGAAFLFFVLLPWLFISTAMAFAFPGGFAATSTALFLIQWCVFWLGILVGTLASESRGEIIRHVVFVGAITMAPTVLYGIVKFFVGHDFIEPVGDRDCTFNLLVVGVVVGVLLPVVCVSAWRNPFGRIRFLRYGPLLLAFFPFITCVPTLRYVSGLIPADYDHDAPRILGSVPAADGGVIRAGGWIMSVNPIVIEDGKFVEVEFRGVSLNSPLMSAYARPKFILYSEDSRQFVELNGSSYSSRGSLLLNRITERRTLDGEQAKTASGLSRPRIAVVSDNALPRMLSGMVNRSAGLDFAPPPASDSAVPAPAPTIVAP